MRHFFSYVAPTSGHSADAVSRDLARILHLTTFINKADRRIVAALPLLDAATKRVLNMRIAGESIAMQRIALWAAGRRGDSKLFLGSLNLVVLPPLPPDLKVLDCQGNCLRSLGTLPAGLTELDCSRNAITDLGTLPAGLCVLYCSNNPLGTSQLPLQLTHLHCTHIGLTAIEGLSDSLVELACGGNPLLRQLRVPPALKTLYCNLNALPEALPASCTHLYVDNKRIPSEDMQAFVAAACRTRHELARVACVVALPAAASLFV